MRLFGCFVDKFLCRSRKSFQRRDCSECLFDLSLDDGASLCSIGELQHAWRYLRRDRQQLNLHVRNGLRGERVLALSASLAVSRPAISWRRALTRSRRASEGRPGRGYCQNTTRPRPARRYPSDAPASVKRWGGGTGPAHFAPLPTDPHETAGKLEEWEPRRSRGLGAGRAGRVGCFLDHEPVAAQLFRKCLPHIRARTNEGASRGSRDKFGKIARYSRHDFLVIMNGWTGHNSSRWFVEYVSLMCPTRVSFATPRPPPPPLPPIFYAIL